MGMTDMQYKSHLRSVIRELEAIKEKTKDEVVIRELDKLIEGFKSDIES